MTGSHYWLAQWLDDNEIYTEWEIEHALQTPARFNSLIEAIFKAAQKEQTGELYYPDPDQLTDSIVAGRKLDLSGTASCVAYDCMRQGIDSTFKRVWHYFDQIVVEGLSPVLLSSQIRATHAEHAYLVYGKIREQARLLLYLREIGAEPFVVFSHKSHAFCQEHWREHARQLGLTAAVDDSQNDKIVQKIMKSSDFVIKEIGPASWHVTVTGKYFSQPVQHVFYPSDGKAPERPTPETITCQIVSIFATAMVSDVSLARHLALPLVEPVTLPWISKQHKNGSKVNVADAAIRIGLPVFDSLTTKDFLKLREDERPDFEAFRAALREAIQIQVTQDPSRSPAAVAKSIEDEYVRPGLADIERRLRSRRHALLKKTAVNFSIGTTVVAIGRMSAMPLLVVEGIAALGSAVPFAPVIQKYIDDGESVKISDLYFLWRAEKQANHR